jgi:hypothetical protein
MYASFLILRTNPEIIVMLRSGCELALGEAPTGMTADGGLVAWAEASGHRRVTGHARGGLRFAFYGRVSTEDWQDPVTSRARQREQAEALVRGHGQVVAEFFDEGQSRSVAWGRRPQAAALVALLADACRVWDAIVVGEYERAFYGSQHELMAPLFEHYGVQLWIPEAGGRVDFALEPRSARVVMHVSGRHCTQISSVCQAQAGRPSEPTEMRIRTTARPSLMESTACSPTTLTRGSRRGHLQPEDDRRAAEVLPTPPTARDTNQDQSGGVMPPSSPTPRRKHSDLDAAGRMAVWKCYV